MAGKTKDLTGMKFGRWTVIKKATDKEYKRPHWICRCECGNEKIVRSDSLVSGNSTNCGCYKSEKMKKLSEQQWQDENLRQMKSEKTKQQWQNEEFRQIMQQLWQDDNYKQKQSEKMKQQWKDENMKWKLGYKGGISTISNYLRNLQILTQWRKDTYIRENSKCQLTGKSVHGGNSDVHHLKAFSTIVKEAHELHNIEIKPQVKDYTDEELQLLEDYVTSWHKDTTNAVLLSKDVHDLFHHVYGSKDNTPEQYEEFKTRYLNGEFENSDSNNNNKVA